MSLEELRNEIDKLDQKIIRLLNERAKISLKISKEKEKLNLPIYNLQREEQVLQKVMRENKGPLTSEQIKSVFQVITNSCRAIQLK